MTNKPAAKKAATADATTFVHLTETEGYDPLYGLNTVAIPAHLKQTAPVVEPDTKKES